MYLVNEDECTGCGACLECCPVGCIAIELQMAEIDQERCTSCGSCYEECPQNAIYEYEESPALYAGNRAVTLSYAAKSPISMIQKTPALTRQEKIAAAAVLLPAVSRFLLRLVGRISLNNSAGRRSPLSEGLQQRQPVGKINQGRHRWRGGS